MQRQQTYKKQIIKVIADEGALNNRREHLITSSPHSLTVLQNACKRRWECNIYVKGNIYINAHAYTNAHPTIPTKLPARRPRGVRTSVPVLP